MKNTPSAAENHTDQGPVEGKDTLARATADALNGPAGAFAYILHHRSLCYVLDSSAIPFSDVL